MLKNFSEFVRPLYSNSHVNKKHIRGNLENKSVKKKPKTKKSRKTYNKNGVE